MILASSSNMKEEILRLEVKLNTQEIHINGIEQYLRVNNFCWLTTNRIARNSYRGYTVRNI